MDPGSIRSGYAIFETQGQQISLVSSGTIVMNAKSDLPTRLVELASDLEAILRKFKPEELALESVFFAQNAQSALQLGQARGVILLKAAESGLKIFEYSPAEVKKSVAGSGRATKDQVEKMIRLVLRLPNTFEFKSADHSDALAIGLTHLQGLEPLRKTKKGKRAPNDRTSFWQTHL